MIKNTKLKIAVINDALPYATCKPYFSGLAIDIWEKTAQKYKLDYEYICIDRNYDKAVEDLHEGKYDVVLADFSVVYNRYDLVQFSRPYYISKLKIYRKKTDSFFYNLITSTALLSLLFSCFLFILVYSIIYKYLLRDTFINSFYETFVNFFVNMREIFPGRVTNSYKKILNALWSIIRYVFYTIVFTKIISIFIKTTDDITPEEVKSISKINVVAGTSYVDFVKKIGKTPIENTTSDDIINKIENSSEKEYWIDDSNLVNKKMSEYNIDLQTTINPMGYDEVTIIVNNNRNDILDKISNNLIEMQDKGIMTKLCKQYFYVEETLNGCEL
jgi:polar amino acid transport system substrate-binding protein